MGVFILVLISVAVYEYKNAEDKNELFSSRALDDIDQQNTKKVNLESDNKGIVWLMIKPKVLKKMKLLAYSMAGINIVFVLLFIYMGIDDNFAMIPLAILIFASGFITLFGIKILN